MLNYFAVLPVLSVVICIGLGLFTLSRNPRHPANIGFAIGMITLAVIGVGNAMILLFSDEQRIVLLGMQVALFGQVILPAGWFLFTLVFARANYKEILVRWKPVLIGGVIGSAFFAFWIGSPQFISILSSNTNHIKDSALTEQSLRFIFGPMGQYFYVYLLVGLVFNLVHLENTLRSSSGTKRWQIKYIIFGVGSIFVFFIYFSTQVLLFSTIEMYMIPAISAVILISVSIITLFIVRHRLLDIDIFISRYVVYNSATVLIVGFYLLAVGIIAEAIKYLGIPSDKFFITIFVFSSILVLLILSFTSTLRRKTQLFINRHFYKHKYEFRDKWMESIEKLGSSRSIEETHGALTKMISETMGAKEIYLWLHDPLIQKYRLTNKKMEMDHKNIGDDHPILQKIRENMFPFIMNDFQREGSELNQINKEINALASATGTVLCAPLVANKDIIGFVLQGEDFSGEPYRKDDFELLSAITTQAAVQIKKIGLAQDLMAAKEIEAFHRLSTFIMHDLKNLTNSLSLVSQNAKDHLQNPEFQKDAIKTVENTVSKMKVLMNKLSSVSKTIDVNKEKVNLKKLVHQVIMKMRLNEAKNVVVTNETDSVPYVLVDPEAMEMVFLNLLTNAYDAITEQGVIKVMASLKEKTVTIIISDNGVGMSREFIEKSLFQPFKSTKKDGFGIGLCHCKAVIEAHGGNIEVESEKGVGTTFSVKLPKG